MGWFKERAPCRRKVKVLLKKYSCSLEELLQQKFFKLSPGMKKQIIKMIQEQEVEEYEKWHT